MYFSLLCNIILYLFGLSAIPSELKYVIITGYGGALSSIGLIILIIPVIKFHIKLKRHLREMTQSMSQYDFAPVMYNTPHQLQQQQQYNNPHQLQQQQYNNPYKY